MQLTLSDDEATLLREVLDATVRDLSSEIADTDNSVYRGRLRDRRDALTTILEAIGGRLPDRG